MYSFDVRYDQFPTIASKYRISQVYSLIAPNRDDGAHFFLRGYTTVYQEQQRASLRFPLYPLIRDILMY